MMTESIRRAVVAVGALLVCSSAFAIQITEIMFHPPGSAEEEDSLEWIEIYNNSATAADLSEYFFSNGIRFEFENGFVIEGKSYLVICSDLRAFTERHDIDNVVGNFTGRLENNGETITLANPSGAPAATVRYRASGRWPPEADGAGYALALKSPIADMSKVDNWARSTFPGGSPGAENFPPPVPVDNEIFPFSGEGAVWRFKKAWDEVAREVVEFSDPPDAWWQPDYDDSGWLEVETPIGFGEDEFVTVLDDMQGNYVAFALRRSFSLTDEQFEELHSLRLVVHVDDGALAYINGQEVGRRGIVGEPNAPYPVTEGARVSGEINRTIGEFTIPKSSVQPGENVLCLQTHNLNLNSGDCGVMASMSYRTFLVNEAPPLPPLSINEVGWTAGGLAFVELLADTDERIELSGLFLSADSENLRAYAFPPGSALPAGERFFVIAPSSLPFELRSLPRKLFLTEPDGETIVDAVNLRSPRQAPSRDWSHARLSQGRGVPWIGVEPTPGAPNSAPREESIVVNEIHYHPVHRPDELEFLELYNRGDAPVNLDGYSLSGGYNMTFGSGGALGPGEYLVVGRKPSALREVYSLSGVPLFGPSDNADAEELETFGRLSNEGERVELRDPYGNIIDLVRYADGGDWDPLADGDGSSLELIDPRQDNSVGHAWTASDESSRSTWIEVDVQADYRTNIPPLPMESELQIFLVSRGECLIDDVSITQGDDGQESLPNGDFEQNTVPWRLTGTHIRSARTTLDAHSGGASLHLVATGAGDQKVNHVEVDTQPALRNGTVRIRFWARWLRGSNVLHLNLFNNAAGTTVVLPVPEDTGTPGRENEARARLREETASDNLGPVISGVIHSPAVPPVSLPITISAKVSDADGLRSVEAVFRWDTEDSYSRAPLFDDGEHGDGAAGDSLYAGSIPGGGEATRYQFYIEATDAEGHSRSYPLEGAGAPLVFMVANGFFPSEAAANDLLRYRVIMDAENVNALNQRLLHSDDLVRGTFVFEEEQVFYNVGLRYRGSPWNRPPSPRMYRVRLPNDRPLRGRQRRINLSRYGRDQHEGVAYQLIRKMSRPWEKAPGTPEYEYINVNINGRAHASQPMAEIQPVDLFYTEFWWPGDSDGWNWKVTGKLAFNDAGQRASTPHWTQFRHYGPSKEDVRYYFNPGIRKEDDVFEPLIELLRALDVRHTPHDEFVERLEGIFNVESSLRVFGVRDFLADWDTIGIQNGQNAYVYYAPLEGRNYLLPWDMDHTFERGGQSMVPSVDPGISRILRTPAFRRMYAAILKEGIEGPWDRSYTDAWMDRIHSVIGPARAANPGAMKTWLGSRRGLVLNFLRPAMNSVFELTTSDPAGFADGAARISGTAPLEVRQFLVSKDEGGFENARPEWRSTTGRVTDLATIWEIAVDGLHRSSHRVDILAFDVAGKLMGSGSLTLLDTTGWEAPTVASVRPARGRIEGGTAVRVLGTGFRPGAELLLGGEPASEVAVVSETEIRGITPAGEEGSASVEVRNIDEQRGILEDGFTYGGEPIFLRGDADGDGSVRINDAISVLTYLFQEGVLRCLDAADSDDDGRISISDPVRVLLHLFRGTVEVAAPFPHPGEDPSPLDPLSCEVGIQ